MPHDARASLHRLLTAIRQWPIGKKLSVGFGITLALSLTASIASILAVRSLISTNNELTYQHSMDLSSVANLRSLVLQEVAIQRGFLLTRDRLFLQDFDLAEESFKQTMGQLRKRAPTAEESKLLNNIESLHKRHQTMLNKAIAMRKINEGIGKIGNFFNSRVMPEYDQLETALERYIKHKTEKLEEVREQNRTAASRAIRLIILNVTIALLFAGALAVAMSQALIQHYNDLKREMSAKQDALATISHDLKNPLTAVLISIGMFLRLSPKQKEESTDSGKIAKTLQSSAQRMQRLIQDLQDIQKIEAGALRIEKKTASAQAILEDAIAVCRPLAQEREIRLESRLIPRGDSPDWPIFCDTERVQQVLLNIVGNAIKFTPKGQTVAAIVEQKEHDTLFIIADTGPGIPEQDLPKLFQRYWQAKETVHGGSGLGLFIAKGFIDAHGGKIWAESTVGKGSKFYFSLPHSMAMATAPSATLPGADADESGFAASNTGLKRNPETHADIEPAHHS